MAEIKAACDADIGHINQERDKLVNQIQEDGRLEQHKVAMEAERYVQQVRAQTTAKVAETHAKILQIRAQAEGYAGERLKRKREYELELGRLEMLQALATNPNTFISGEVGENALAQLVTATRAAAAMGIKPPTVVAGTTPVAVPAPLTRK
jgi:hypothetical protein